MLACPVAVCRLAFCSSFALRTGSFAPSSAFFPPRRRFAFFPPLVLTSAGSPTNYFVKNVRAKKKKKEKKKRKRRESFSLRSTLSPSRANKNYPTTVGYIFAHVNRPLKPSINPFFLSFNLRFFSLSLSFILHRAVSSEKSNRFERISSRYRFIFNPEKERKRHVFNKNVMIRQGK